MFPVNSNVTQLVKNNVMVHFVKRLGKVKVDHHKKHHLRVSLKYCHPAVQKDMTDLIKLYYAIQYFLDKTMFTK